MKKFIIFLCVCVVCFFNVQPSYLIYASSKNEQLLNLEEELSDNVFTQLSTLDFSGLDYYLTEINNSYSFTDLSNIKEVVSKIAGGEYFTDFSSVLDGLINILFSNIKNFIPIIFLIIAIAVVASILNSLKSSVIGSGVNDIIHFVCYSVVVLLLVANVTKVIDLTNSALTNMTNQMEIVFPILLTLLTAVGGVSSVGIYKPIVAVLTQGVGVVFSKVLFPIFVVSFIFLIVGNLSKNIKLDKFCGFLSSVFKWIVGFVFTLFASFLTIQGVSAGKFDGISVKATKFAVKSYVPLIGGYISDGFDLILCASVIIKNAVGVVGLVLVLFTIISPVIQILVLKLGLQLVSAILEPIGETQISNFATGCSKILIYPIVLILAVAFMYVLSVGLIMTTANVV